MDYKAGIHYPEYLHESMVYVIYILAEKRLRIVIKHVTDWLLVKVVLRRDWSSVEDGILENSAMPYGLPTLGPVPSLMKGS